MRCKKKEWERRSEEYDKPNTFSFFFLIIVNFVSNFNEERGKKIF
jgi:hypothetical protein